MPKEMTELSELRRGTTAVNRQLQAERIVGERGRLPWGKGSMEREGKGRKGGGGKAGIRNQEPGARSQEENEGTVAEQHCEVRGAEGAIEARDPGSGIRVSGWKRMGAWERGRKGENNRPTGRVSYKTVSLRLSRHLVAA